MENPEMEFLQYLLSRFVDMNDIDVERASLKELMDKLSEELTPIGGGYAGKPALELVAFSMAR